AYPERQLYTSLYLALRKRKLGAVELVGRPPAESFGVRQRRPEAVRYFNRRARSVGQVLCMAEVSDRNLGTAVAVAVKEDVPQFGSVRSGSQRSEVDASGINDGFHYASWRIACQANSGVARRAGDDAGGRQRRGFRSDLNFLHRPVAFQDEPHHALRLLFGLHFEIIKFDARKSRRWVFPYFDGAM